MVKRYSEQLDRTFFALSDPTRRAIIGNLALKGSCTVSALAEPFAMSAPAISKHLKLLEDANLIMREQKGRYHQVRLRSDPMLEAEEWLVAYRQFWLSRLDLLEKYMIEEMKKGEIGHGSNTAKADSGSKQNNKCPDRKGFQSLD